MTRPNLFIVGAPKCGTTAWVQYLSSHPDIYFSPMKEPHYFNTDFPRYRWVKDRDSYLKLFEGAGAASVVGEASVQYLYSEAAAEEIARFNPEAKIIIFVRDQEDFLPSLHNQLVSNGDETVRDFRRAWQLSGSRDKDTIGSFCREPKFLDYKRCGEFTGQVERYFANFQPEQIRVLHFRDWTTDPRSIYLELLSFLGLGDDGRTEFPPVNTAYKRYVNWLTPHLRRPPRFVVEVTERLKRIAGIPSLGLIEAAARLNSRPGYVSRISDALRQEIRSYYEEDNASLKLYLWEAPKSD